MHLFSFRANLKQILLYTFITIFSFANVSHAVQSRSYLRPSLLYSNTLIQGIPTLAEPHSRKLHPAAELYLNAGRNIDEQELLKLQSVLRIMLRSEGEITVSDIKDDVEVKMKALNAIQQNRQLEENELSELFEQLYSVGIIEAKRDINGVSKSYYVEHFQLAAIWADDLHYVKEEIEGVIHDTAQLKDLLLRYENICEILWKGYHVEKSYVVKSAVSMLTKEHQHTLIEKIKIFEEEDGDVFYAHYIFDEIRLELLPSSEIDPDWLLKYAPDLRGRTIVIVSPEISRKVGGLGRVNTYDTVGMIHLAGKHAKIVNVEPCYKGMDQELSVFLTQRGFSELASAIHGISIDWRIDIESFLALLALSQEDVVDIDESLSSFQESLGSIENSKLCENLKDIFARKGLLMEPMDEDKITAQVRKDKIANVKIYKNTKIFLIPNEAGEIEKVPVETYYIKDEENYYVGEIYKYSCAESPASYDEFSDFFSKAVLELTQRAVWKHPFLYLQDGQCLPIAFWKRLEYDNELKNVPVADRTHTHRNRGIQEFDSLEKAHEELNKRRIPREYHHYWLRSVWTNEGKIKYLIDFSSSGIRTADGVNAVSRMHVYEIAKNDPMAFIEALTNGDLRALSAMVFRSILRKEFGQDIDVEHLTPEQIIRAKISAKKMLQDLLKEKSEAGFVHGDIKLDPEKIVIGYGGRAVPVKLGMNKETPAFTEDNIRSMAEAGAQVIIFAKQAGYGNDIYQRLTKLADEIANDRTRYKGTFIFVTDFDIWEQILFLAALDLQVQVSMRGTEAAGLTESDAMACGALQLASLWLEGILKQHVWILDKTQPGVGDTIGPYDNTEEAFREAFNWAIECYAKRRLDYAKYQVTSCKLSRVLEQRCTSAECLKWLNGVVAGEDEFGGKLEARNDDMTKAVLIMEPYGIHIERLTPELPYTGSAPLPEDVIDNEITVEAVLLLQPWVDAEKIAVDAVTDAALYHKETQWAFHRLSLISFDGYRAIYRTQIPVHLVREEFGITWQIKGVWLGTYANDARVAITARIDTMVEELRREIEALKERFKQLEESL